METPWLGDYIPLPSRNCGSNKPEINPKLLLKFNAHIPRIIRGDAVVCDLYPPWCGSHASLQSYSHTDQDLYPTPLKIANEDCNGMQWKRPDIWRWYIQVQLRAFIFLVCHQPKRDNSSGKWWRLGNEGTLKGSPVTTEPAFPSINWG